MAPAAKAQAIDELPLFPLRAVLFPGGLLALKVFEARYLDLVGQCLREGLPFGVVCLRAGSEAGRELRPVRFEDIGVFAHITEVDGEQAGILQLRCTGGSRFRLSGRPRQQDDGLWLCAAERLPDDEATAPPLAMQPTVQALAKAIETLKEQGALPFVEPYFLDDAGWVANRWCELLPISLAAKQKLMQLDDAAVRLALVDEYLRGKQVVRDD